MTQVPSRPRAISELTDADGPFTTQIDGIEGAEARFASAKTVAWLLSDGDGRLSVRDRNDLPVVARLSA